MDRIILLLFTLGGVAAIGCDTSSMGPEPTDASWSTPEPILDVGISQIIGAVGPIDIQQDEVGRTHALIRVPADEQSPHQRYDLVYGTVGTDWAELLTLSGYGWVPEASVAVHLGNATLSWTGIPPQDLEQTWDPWSAPALFICAAASCTPSHLIYEPGGLNLFGTRSRSNSAGVYTTVRATQNTLVFEFGSDGEVTHLQELPRFSYPTSQIVGDTLHVAYVSAPGNALYYSRIVEGRAEQPQLLIAWEGLAVHRPVLEIDERSGSRHLAFYTITPGSESSVYYMRSPNGADWSQPVRLLTRPIVWQDTPQLFVVDDTAHIFTTFYGPNHSRVRNGMPEGSARIFEDFEIVTPIQVSIRDSAGVAMFFADDGVVYQSRIVF